MASEHISQIEYRRQISRETLIRTRRGMEISARATRAAGSLGVITTSGSRYRLSAE